MNDGKNGRKTKKGMVERKITKRRTEWQKENDGKKNGRKINKNDSKTKKNTKKNDGQIKEERKNGMTKGWWKEERMF